MMCIDELLGGPKSDKCMGVSQLLGACARAAHPKVYAYIYIYIYIYNY